MSKRFCYYITVASGHSLRSFAEILYNPVAFDLQSFDSSAKTCVGVVFSKAKFLSVSVRNPSKDLSTSVMSLLRLGPISVTKGLSISAISDLILSNGY